MKNKLSLKQFSLGIIFSAVLVILTGIPSLAQVNIVTSVPDFAAIAKEIGGDRVEVTSLARGYQDPHFVDAKPIFITRLNQADMLIYNGLDLEVGWLPILITGSRNSKITSPHEIGHYNVSVSLNEFLEVPTVPIDRSMGDVHPGGNPHFMLDPRKGIPVARSITARLIRIDPENASYYEENYNNFVSALKLKISEWETELMPFKGTKVVTYHRLWSYFLDWAGFKSAGTIEPRPGIPPSPSHTAEIISTMEREDIRLIIAANYYPRKTASIIAQKTGATFLSLPAMVGGQDGIDTYIELFDALVGEITSALKNTTGSSEVRAGYKDG